MRLRKSTILVAVVLLVLVLVPLAGALPVHAAGSVPNNSTPVSDDFCTNKTWTLCFSGIIYWIAVGIGGYVASIAASFLNYAIGLSLNSYAYALDFTGIGWGIMRDLANMAFIFIIIYIAFTIMFRAETTNTLRNLAAVIVVALLVNFSFFFTRVVIDVGNILAVQFYNAVAQQVPQVQQALPGAPLQGGATADLTAPIMNAVKLQNLLNTNSFAQINKLIGTQDFTGAFATFLSLSLLFIALGIMLVVIAASFLFAGVKFLLRVVGLWFVIIASPLAFAARALPSNSTAMNLFNQWRSALVSFTFYPAVYLFIFYIITQFMKGISGQGQNLISGAVANIGNGSTLASLSNPGSTDSISTIIAGAAIRVGLVCILLYVAYILADKIITTGNQLAGRVLSRAGRIGIGGLGFAGRLGIGGASNFLAQSQALSESKNPLARGLWQGSRWVSKRSFDLRAAPGVSSGLGRLGIDVGGPGGKGGWRGFEERAHAAQDRWAKASEEDRKKIRERVAGVENRENVKRLKKINKTWDTDEKELETLRNNVKKGISLDPPAENRLKHLESLDDERRALSKRIEDFNAKEVTSLKAADIEGIIKQISAEHLKAIQESAKYTKGEIDSISKKWHEENKKAPIGKSKEELQKLDKIHETLKGLGISLKSIKERGIQSSGDTVISLKNAKDSMEELEDKKDELEAQKQGASGAARKEIQQGINQLNKAIKKTQAVIDNLDKVPEGVGDRNPPGEYVIKRP